MFDMILLGEEPLFHVVGRTGDGVHRHGEEAGAQRAAHDQENLGGFHVSVEVPLGGVKHRVDNRAPGEDESNDGGQVHRRCLFAAAEDQM